MSRKYEKTSVTIHRFLIGMLLGMISGFIIYLLTSCGAYAPGETDRKIDCIDGCNFSDESIQGPEGPRGPRGPAGEVGPGCTVNPMSNGAIIECEDGSNALIFNGQNGTDGLDGQAGQDGQDGKDAEPGMYTFEEVIDPCGPEGAFDEILFRTYNREIIAVYYEKKKYGFLTFLSPGNYITTDGTKCAFTVTSEGEVIW